MSKKKTKTDSYVLEALKALQKYLIQDRRHTGVAQFKANLINTQGLEKAIKNMPKEDKENIEKFWGLDGGVNHSKKMGLLWTKDIAFNRLRNKALISLRKLSRLEFIAMYYEGFDDMINAVAKKIDKQGYFHISDLESVKYLMAYFIIVENGPKMSFEEDPMSVETKIDKICYLDEYQALYEMCKEVEKIPDKSIKLGLIVNVFEMMDLYDTVVVQQNFGIEIPEETLKLFNPNEIESIQTFGQIRNFKERVFKHGAWEVTSKIVLGKKVEIQFFAEEIARFCRDWSRLEDAKKGQKQLKTSKELITLDLYNVGGLQFTDTYEIEFLYLMNCFV